MQRDEIIRLLEKAIIQAQEKGQIPPVAIPEILLEHPQNPDHGDYASTIALKLGRAARANPLEIAQAIGDLLPKITGIDKITVVPPGFINFTLGKEWLCKQVDEIINQGSRFGTSALRRDMRTQVEFVSVNPTGPLHVGHGRGAVLGDTLANILRAAGSNVEKEYYINDAGNQMQVFYDSLCARYREVLGYPAEMPPDGYHGEYMKELAREIADEKGDLFQNNSWEEAFSELSKVGFDKIIGIIKSDLNLLGVEFDVWFSENSLHTSGLFERIMAQLKENGHVEEKEEAIWFVSTELGEDKDNVLIRSSGIPTYFASDITYHYNKFIERNFDKVIDIWGADHQGHVSRMKLAIEALGITPDRLEVLIAQMVSLRRGEEQVKVSKRTGDMITLRELIDEVGIDVCRFFFLSRSANSQMDFDLELAKKQSMDNPVYYVQYAYARIAGILRLAQEKGIDHSKGDTSLLCDPAEFDLIKKLLLLPELIESMADNLEPHHLPYYAQDLATTFHNFYEKCRVVTDDGPLTCARLRLAEASKVTLANVLGLMGMTTPERM